ncbi:MAG: hypothetical protein KDK28_14010, partial [Maritimibacter sp.]|nr:hypothetical protein [Maritimibacter sp.]
MKRCRINTPALLGLFAGALIAVATMAHADDSDINALIGADDIGTGHATAPAAGPATTPSTAAPAGTAAST